MNADTPRPHGAEASLLGQAVAYRDTYAPALLFPIERQLKRDELGIAAGALHLDLARLAGAARRGFFVSVPGRAGPHRVDVSLSIGRSAAALAFPQHAAEAVHHLVVGVVHRIEPRGQQFQAARILRGDGGQGNELFGEVQGTGHWGFGGMGPCSQL